MPWSRSSSNSSSGDSGAAALVLLFVVIIIVMLLIMMYLTVKATNLIVRVFARYPHTKALYVALFPCLAVWIVALLAAPQAWVDDQTRVVLFALASGGTAVLLIVCKITELAHDRLFQRERSGGALIEDVLDRPWWQPLEPAA